MTWKLFLDDIRMPDQVGLQNHEYFIARSFDEAINLIKQKESCPIHICFDHDLSFLHYVSDFSDEKTGYHFAQWLVEQDLNARERGENFLPEEFTFSVHSMNPIGRENIIKLMTNYLAYCKQ